MLLCSKYGLYLLFFLSRNFRHDPMRGTMVTAEEHVQDL